jgi:NodT family efflux transporter outer membrane factor (OMF) lipoprotein
VKTQHLTLVMMTFAFLPACRVGPKYVRPTAPDASTYKEIAPDEYSQTLSGVWHPAQPQDATLKGKWWEIFNEPELNELEEQLNINNQNIAQFFQNFMAAKAQVREARAGYFPTVSFNPALTRGGTAATSAARTTNTASTTNTAGATTIGGTPVNLGGGFSFYSLPVEVSWAPDLWGRIGNTVREFQYGAQVSAADLENEKLTEQAALASFFFELRGQDELKDLYNRTIEAYRKALELTRALVETGIDSPEAVAQAEVTLENAEAVGIGISTNRAIYEHAIATLIGKPASTFSMPAKRLTTPVPEIPVGIPSQLLERRPDIAAAERTMAQANALIGVATAAYYPLVNLTSSGGFESSILKDLISVPSLFWSLGASAAQTIFDAGLRKATVAQFTATYNADVAGYRQTVLTAFQQVEDFIATLRITSEQIIKQDDSIESAQRYVQIATARWETGLDPYLNVISAQTNLLSNQQSRVILRVNEMTAAVELVEALGGGWDASQLPTPAQVTAK